MRYPPNADKITMGLIDQREAYCKAYLEAKFEIDRLKEEVKGLEQTVEICRTDRDNALRRMHQKVISSHKRGNEFLKEFCPDLALTTESWHKFYKMWREGVQPLVDERDRYRMALESISKNMWCDSCREAALVAKAALQGVGGENK